MSSSTNITPLPLSHTTPLHRRDWFSLDQLLAHQPPLSTLTRTTGYTTNMGLLSRLPVELALSILESLPIHALLRFRLASPSTLAFTSQIPSFRLLTRVAPTLLHAIAATSLRSETVTLPFLARKIRQKECDAPGCKRNGLAVMLPSCRRICLPCLQDRANEGSWPKTRSELIFECKVVEERVEARASFVPLACRFTNGAGRFEIVEGGRERYYDACPEKGKSSEGEGADSLVRETEPEAWSASPEALYLYLSRKMSLLFHMQLRREEAGMRASREVVTLDSALPVAMRRHMSVVLAPWPDEEGTGPEEMVFCRRCEGGEGALVAYGRREFDEHLGVCKGISMEWEDEEGEEWLYWEREEEFRVLDL